METPLVSVVIPTFDRPKFLNRAIQSVLAQDYSNLEIIVVVDGYSKNTAKLVNEIQNNRISLHLIQTKEKVGGSEARNIGARNSDGPLVALLDDDDEWFEDKISAQIELIQKNNLTSENDFLCFTSIERYKDKEQAVYDKLPNVDYKDSNRVKIVDYLFETEGLRNIGFIQTSSILVPRRLLLKTPFTKGLIKHQDWDWLLNLDKDNELTILQVESPKLIYHSDIPKNERVGYTNRWRFTEQWFMSHKEEFSLLGYESFVLNYILMGIASDAALTKRERLKETSSRFNKLTLKTKLRPYTWKMVLYMVMGK